jgi:hypothetical protein
MPKICHKKNIGPFKYVDPQTSIFIDFFLPYFFYFKKTLIGLWMIATLATSLFLLLLLFFNDRLS